ncbi:MAG: AI-2E family transporter [bacterium]|nr:AI-2E family transporter [bacterium]
MQKLDITTTSWVRGVAVVAIAAALFMVRDLILVILASIVIASAIEPVTLWARRRSIPRLLAVICVYVVLGLFTAGAIYFLILPLLGEVSSFVRTLPLNTPALEEGISGVEGVFDTISSRFSIAEISSNLNALANSLSQGVFSTVSSVFGGVVSFVLIVVLSFYLAVQDDGVGKFLRVVTPANHEKYVIGLWKRSQHKIGLWMQGQLLISVLVAVLVYLGLLLLGIEHALLLAVLAGIFEIIPLFGPILAAIPALFIAYSGGGTPDLLLVAGLYLIIQQFENHLLYPLVVKKVVGVPPIISIIALIVGGTLAGFIGVLISVPLAAIFMELFSDIEERKNAKLSATL